MAIFAFIVPPLAGHVNPTLALGGELIKRKHEVVWIGLDPNLEEQLPLGGKLELIPIELTEEEKVIQEKHIEELKKKTVYGIESLKFLYEEVLIPMNTFIFPGITKLIDKLSPDIIITDHQLFAGSVAAIKKNIPYATSVTAPASIKVNDNLPMIHQWEGEQVISFQKKFGITEDNRLDISPLLTLVYTSETFFGDSDLPSNYKFIGPSINSRFQTEKFDWKKVETMGNRPKVLVTIGTTFDHSQKLMFFKKLTEALENENLTVIVVSDPSLFENIPDNFIIQKEVPQLELIPHMQAVICHGGHNTVCETLSYGIPLVVIPIAYDQSYVSGCVVDNEAGIRLKFTRFKPLQLKEAVYSVMENENYRIGANKVRKSFDEAGGVIKGADYLEALLKK